MSKSAPTRRSGQLLFPAIAIGGHLSVSVGDRSGEAVCRAPSGEKASKPLTESRQQQFDILLRIFDTPPGKPQKCVHLVLRGDRHPSNALPMSWC
jgi:hypothetical protein